MGKTPLSRNEATTLIAKMDFQETQGKKGRQLAAKVAGVKKKKIPIGEEIRSTPNKGLDIKTVYKAGYTPRQKDKIEKTQKKIQRERGSQYYSAATRTAELARTKKSKKK